MNPETLINAVLDMVMATINGPHLAELTDAIIEGAPTDEQLAEFTVIVHGEFDKRDGCMIDTIVEMHEVGWPHYAIMHAIRTYVRKNDAREAGFKVREV